MQYATDLGLTYLFVRPNFDGKIEIDESLFQRFLLTVACSETAQDFSVQLILLVMTIWFRIAFFITLNELRRGRWSIISILISNARLMIILAIVTVEVKESIVASSAASLFLLRVLAHSLFIKNFLKASNLLLN